MLFCNLNFPRSFWYSSGSILGQGPQYEFQINGWLPTIKPTPPTGETLNWSLSDLLSNLDMMAQFGGGARKGKWSMAADFLYLNLGDKRTISGEIIHHPVEVEADLDLRALPFTLTAGYQVTENGKNRIDIIGGVRYIYIRVPITLSLGDQLLKLTTPKIITWDGIVGLQGKTTINDQWYFDYYGDIGTGQSDITWQIKAGFGYNFNKWTALFGYRHLRRTGARNAAGRRGAESYTVRFATNWQELWRTYISVHGNKEPKCKN